MVTEAYGRLDQLQPLLQADARSLVGWTVTQEEVFAQPPAQDCWRVLAQTTDEECRIRTRSTWLRGLHSGRWALLLHSAAGPGFRSALHPGIRFDRALCFYPAPCVR